MIVILMECVLMVNVFVIKIGMDFHALKNVVQITVLTMEYVIQYRLSVSVNMVLQELIVLRKSARRIVVVMKEGNVLTVSATAKTVSQE